MAPRDNSKGPHKHKYPKHHYPKRPLESDRNAIEPAPTTAPTWTGAVANELNDHHARKERKKAREEARIAKWNAVESQERSNAKQHKWFKRPGVRSVDTSGQLKEKWFKENPLPATIAPGHKNPETGGAKQVGRSLEECLSGGTPRETSVKMSGARASLGDRAKAISQEQAAQSGKRSSKRQSGMSNCIKIRDFARMETDGQVAVAGEIGNAIKKLSKAVSTRVSKLASQVYPSSDDKAPKRSVSMKLAERRIEISKTMKKKISKLEEELRKPYTSITFGEINDTNRAKEHKESVKQSSTARQSQQRSRKSTGQSKKDSSQSQSKKTSRSSTLLQGVYATALVPEELSPNPTFSAPLGDMNRSIFEGLVPASEPLSRVAPLPAGWEERMAPNGRPYWLNHADRSTSWVRPS